MNGAGSITWRSATETIALALVGAGVGEAIGLPVGALAGALAATAAASLAGRPIQLPTPARDLGLYVVGVAGGAAVTPAVAAAAVKWPLSLGLLVAASGLMWWAGYVVYRRFAWAPKDALYAALPGALATTLALASAQQADVRRVAIAHSVRLAALSGLVPFLAAATAHAPVGPTGHAGGAIEWAALIGATALAGLGAARLRLPAAWALGPLTISAALHGFGWTTLSVPHAALFVGYALIGAIVGQAFRDTRPRQVLALLGPSLAALAATSALALGFGAVAAAVTGRPLFGVLLAFAPGGMEAMMAVSLALGLDTAFVAVHHLARWLGLTMLAPLLDESLRRRI